MAANKGAPASVLNPTTFQEAREFAAIIAGSDLAPKDYRGKPDNILVAMQMGAEVGLNPMQALQNIAVINGRPSIWGDAMLAICQASPLYGGIEETFDEATMTATCTVIRKGQPPVVGSFSKSDAETAKLWGKTGHSGQPTPWVTYPKRMLRLRARGFALRDAFADALRGMISAEESEDTPIDVTPKADPPPTGRTDGALQHLEGYSVEEVDTSTLKTEQPEETPQTEAEGGVSTEAPAIPDGMDSAGKADGIFDMAIEAGESVQAAWDGTVKGLYDAAPRPEQKVIAQLLHFYLDVVESRPADG